MNSIWETPFIVVDVETTGAKADTNRVIDIACVTVMGGQIVSRYDSLVNARQFIPYFIQQMTHINNEMIFTAPEPEQVFADIEKIFSTPNAVFVAHNASFDYAFVNHEFIRNDFGILEMPKLCTLKLARRLIPTKSKKNVGALSEYFSINIRHRHRALGDADATAQILIELLEKVEFEHGIETIEELLAFQNKQIKHFRPSSKTYERIKDKLEILPEEPGVYYYYGKKDEILYIGKAKSLKSRVNSYFRNDTLTSRKISDMVKQVHDIKWELTGTELSALMLESRELKFKRPPYNTADKIYRRYLFIKLNLNDKFPVIELTDKLDHDGSEYFGPFRSMRLITEIATFIEKQFKLRKCNNTIKTDENNKPCFYHQIERCYSPCSRFEAESEYSSELDSVINFLSGNSESVITELQNKMFDLSEQLKFEEAAVIKYQIEQLKRVFDRRQQVPTSINKNNLIFVAPASSEEKTVEVIMIKFGKLIFQGEIGRKADLNSLFEIIHTNYFSEDSSVLPAYTQEEIDELRIVTGWIYRQNGSGQIIYFHSLPEQEICNQLEFAVRNTEYNKGEDEEDFIEN
ncbi:MAG: DEDD exonuclease domain-containing protein [Bacteroidota bacterium]